MPTQDATAHQQQWKRAGGKEIWYERIIESLLEKSLRMWAGGWCHANLSNDIETAYLWRKEPLHFLAKNNTVIMLHTPYSPDLDTCEFACLQSSKDPWKGGVSPRLMRQRLNRWKNLKLNIKKCFEDCKKRWHKCIMSKEAYFEEDKIYVDE